MLNQTLAEKIEVLNSVEKTGLFSFVAVTSKKPTAEDAPANLREVKVYFAGVVSLGNDYQAAVNRRLEQEGKAANFKAKGTYCGPISDNRLLFKHHTKELYYLRVYPNLTPMRQSSVRVFDANGVEITNWSEVRKKYFASSGGSKSQGLDNEIIVRNYSLENVKYLKRGEVLIDEVTTELAKVTAK